MQKNPNTSKSVQIVLDSVTNDILDMLSTADKISRSEEVRRLLQDEWYRREPVAKETK